MESQVVTMADNWEEEKAVRDRIAELVRERRSLEAQGVTEGVLDNTEIAQKARQDVTNRAQKPAS